MAENNWLDNNTIDYDSLDENSMNSGDPYSSNGVDFSKQPLSPEEEAEQERLLRYQTLLKEAGVGQEDGKLGQEEGKYGQEEAKARLEQAKANTIEQKIVAENIKADQAKAKNVEAMNPIPLKTREDGKPNVPVAQNRAIETGSVSQEALNQTDMNLEGMKTPFRKSEIAPQQVPTKTANPSITNPLDGSGTPNSYPNERLDMENSNTQDLIQDSMSPREKLLAEFKKAKEENEAAKKRAVWIDAISNMGKGLAQYGADVGAAKASAIGAGAVQARDLGFKKTNTYDKVAKEYQTKLARFDKQSAILDKKEQLAIVQNDKKEAAKIQAEKFDLEKKYKNAQIDAMKNKNKEVSKEEQDYNSNISRTRQDILLNKMRASGIDVTEKKIEAIRKIPASALRDEKDMRNMIRKSPTEITKENLEFRKEKHKDKMTKFPKTFVQTKVGEAIATLSGQKGVRSLMPMDQRRLTLAEDSKRIIEMVKAGKFPSNRQVSAELASLLAATMSATGNVSEEQINSFKASSAYGDIKNMIEYFAGTPLNTVTDDQLKTYEHQVDGQIDFYLDTIAKLSDVSREGFSEMFKQYPEYKKMYDRAVGTTIQSLNAYKKSGLLEKYKDEIYKKPNQKKTESIKKAPYQSQHNKDDLFEKDGKTWKWNSTKGKYQLYK